MLRRVSTKRWVLSLEVGLIWTIRDRHIGRAGWTEEDVEEISGFPSGGMRYQGLIAGRKSDVLGIGAAYGGTSNYAVLTANHENVVDSVSPNYEARLRSEKRRSRG